VGDGEDDPLVRSTSSTRSRLCIESSRRRTSSIRTRTLGLGDGTTRHRSCSRRRRFAAVTPRSSQNDLVEVIDRPVTELLFGRTAADIFATRYGFARAHGIRRIDRQFHAISVGNAESP
jgi:hypothetical protein